MNQVIKEDTKSHHCALDFCDIDFEKEMCMSLQDEINKTLQDKERSDRIAKYMKDHYRKGWKRI